MNQHKTTKRNLEGSYKNYLEKDIDSHVTSLKPKLNGQGSEEGLYDILQNDHNINQIEHIKEISGCPQVLFGIKLYC